MTARIWCQIVNLRRSCRRHLAVAVEAGEAVEAEEGAAWEGRVRRRVRDMYRMYFS
jgi:hypothetical protein